VGAALYRTFVARGWIRRAAEGRTVTFSPPGREALRRHFGVEA